MKILVDLLKFLDNSYNLSIKRINYTSILEEIINAIIHGLGVIFGIVGVAVLLIFSSKNGNIEKIVGLSIFGATLILMYLISTLFHCLSYTRAKRVFRILDHSSIFLFIAGTYSLFTLVTLKGSLGIILLTAVWMMAICGILFRIFYIDKLKLSLVMYLSLGWMGVVLAAKPLVSHLPARGFTLLLSGGIIYSVGILFYIWKRLRFHHGLWHLCVLGGSVCHFAAMFYI